MEPPSPTHIGPYRLLHLLGRGGMGEVFAAVHEQMGQRVALKRLLPTGDPQLVARFLQEARALARLEHPGVVRIHHCDRVGDTAFLAMELLEGLSLREWMQRHPGPVPLPTALGFCGQIAAVMADVHARGIVHRDLKPENVFLCPDEAAALGHRVKLLDFGLAKLPPAEEEELSTTQVHTHESTFLGTYIYMAPEQLRSAATVDGHADVYALGVLLFEMLAGRTPFVADDPLEIISSHLREEPPSLKQWVPALPGALSAFVASMLAKEQAERPTMSRCRDMLGSPWEQTQGACPVPGLAPFTEVQAELFFGRQEEAHALCALFEEARSGRRRWVQLEGPSGVGKSSLLQAGLLPRLKDPPESGGPRWLIAPLRPSYEPLRSLARALATAYASTGLPATLEEVERALSEGPDGLCDFVTTRTPEGELLLMLIDPMEELFTLGLAESHRLDALLSSALAAPECPLRLLTSLRSDFLHRMEHLPSLARQLPGAARYPLLPMGEEALAQVVQGMARLSGLRLGAGLASRMVHDARGEGSRLPLLGHALRELWALSGGAPLTLEHYERLGGVGGALARQAEGLLDSLGPEGRARAKWLLLELVQVGRGVPDTRRPRLRDEVLAAAGGDRQAEEVLLRLTGMRTGTGMEEEQGLRLVTLSGGEEPSHQRAELVHETLLHKVPSLVAWIEQERAQLERQAELEAIAHTWEQAKCPAEGLPTGSLLARYRGEPESPPGSKLLARRVSSRAAHFLQAAERLERRRAWGRRTLIAIAVVAGLLILFSAVRAEKERQHAEKILQQIISAADEMVGSVDWKLSRFPHIVEERKKLLKDFLDKLNSLPMEDRQRPDVRLVIIKLYQRLADLAFQHETLAKADSLLHDALRAGLDDEPEDLKLLKELALNRSKRGKVAIARDDQVKAREHFTEAISLMRRPGVMDDNKEDDRRILAVSLTEMAELELVTGNLATAAVLSEHAFSLHMRNSGAYNQYLLAHTLCVRGEIAWKDGKPSDAEDYLQQALRLARSSVHEVQGNQLYRWILAWTLIKLGELRVEQRRPEDAKAHYAEALKLGQALYQGEPTNKRHALVLAQALLGLGQHREACERVHEVLSKDLEDVRFLSMDCPR